MVESDACIEDDKVDLKRLFFFALFEIAIR